VPDDYRSTLELPEKWLGRPTEFEIHRGG